MQTDPITQHKRLIHKAIYTVLPRLQHADHDDVFQDVALHLHRYSLPKFDPKRCSLATFIFAVSFRRAQQMRRGFNARRRRERAVGLDAARHIAARDRFADAAIERLAQALIDHPETLLAPALCTALATLGQPLANAARRTGYNKSYIANLRTKLKASVLTIAETMLLA